MTIIIRLQGLPWAASALDIRHYFKGLTIPDGGVHIVGGESGDAFIAFGGDEDARKAMLMTTPLCGKKVTLMLSSKNEMQSVIAASRAAQARKRGDPFEGAIEAGNSVGLLPPPVPDERGFDRPKVPPVSDDRGYDRPKVGMAPDADHGSAHLGFPSSGGRHSSDPYNSPGAPYDGRPEHGPYGRPDEPAYHHRGHDPPRGYDPPHLREPPPHSHDSLLGPEPSRGHDPLRRHDPIHGHERSMYGKSMHDPISPPYPYDQRDARGDQPGYPGYDDRDIVPDPPIGRGAESSHMGRMGEAPVRDPLQPRHGPYHPDRSHEPPPRRESDPQGGSGEQAYRNGRFERPFPEDPYLPRRHDDTIPTGGRMEEAHFRGGHRYNDLHDSPESRGRPFDLDRRRGSQEGRYGGEVSAFDQDRRESQYRSSSRYGEDRPRGRSEDRPRGHSEDRPRGHSRERPDQTRHSERPYSDDRHGRPPYGNAEQTFPPSMRTDNITSVVLKGLPYSVAEEDIKKFLAGLKIEPSGIHVGTDRSGKTTGTAFVKLVNRSDFEEALKRDKRYIGTRYIDVQPCSEREWLMMNDTMTSKRSDSYFASKQGPPYSREPRRARSRSPPKDTLCISLRGLPFHTEKRHILDFFKGIEPKEEDIFLEKNERGQASGWGYVEFKSLQDYRSALERNRNYIGPRYITVISISREELVSRIKEFKKKMGETMTQKPVHPVKETAAVMATKETENGSKDTNQKKSGEQKKNDKETNDDLCIHMQNVPYAASTADIADFLSGIPVPKQNICRIFNEKGQTTGEVFIEFYSLDFAKQAAARNNGNIRERTIYVDRVKKSVMEKRLKENEANSKLAQEKRAAAVAAAANASQPPLLATPPIAPRLVPADMRRREWPPRPMGMRDQQREGGYGYDSKHDELPSGGDNLGDMTCVIGATNLPYRTTIPEIMEFFHGYGALQDSIRIHFNDAGQPTGDALVAFDTKQHALRALRELHNKLMGPRRVQLYLA